MQLKFTQTVQTSEVSELSCRIQKLVLLEQATTNHDKQQPQDSECVLDDFYENWALMALCALCMRIFMYDICNLSSTLCQYSFCYFWICLWATISAAMDPCQRFWFTSNSRQYGSTGRTWKNSVQDFHVEGPTAFHSQVVTLNKGRQEQILKYKQVTRTMFQSKFHYVYRFKARH